MNPDHQRALLAGALLALVVVIGLTVWFAMQGVPTTATLTDAGAESTEQPSSTSSAYADKQPLTIEEDRPRAVSLVIDVLTPQAARTALFENEWLTKALGAPLGRGFLGSWAAFLGSSRGDVGLEGAGLVRDAIVDALVTGPMRVVMFEGEPALPPAALADAKASTAVSALTTVLQRGGFVVDACPGETAAPPDAGPESASKQIEIVRWVIAEHELYLADTRGRIVISKSPRSVVAGVCAQVPELTTNPGVDVQVRPQFREVGRPVEMMAQMLGLSKDVALSWKVEGTRLVPVGISGAIEHPERIGDAAIAEQLIKAVPADMPVVVSASVNLPEKIDQASLAAVWSNQKVEGQKARTVVAVWEPRGDRKAPTAVAILWSDEGDRDSLTKIFSGKNAMSIDSVCGAVVLSSTTELMSRIKATCKGTVPSLAFAEPSVVAGLKGQQSVSLIVDGGAVLAKLLDDGWRVERAAAGAAERDKSKPEPKEIEDAKKLLDELPRHGLVGTKSANALTPRGFSS